MDVISFEEYNQWLKDNFGDKYDKLEISIGMNPSDIFNLINYKTRLECICKPCIESEGKNVGCETCPEANFTINVSSSNYYNKLVFVETPCVYYNRFKISLGIEENARDSGLVTKSECNFDKYVIGNASLQAAYDRCKWYVDKYETIYKKGLGLYLQGASGTGKTHLACAIGIDLLALGHRVKFISTAALHNSYKALMGSDSSFKAYSYIEEIANYDGLLILDDVGTEVGTDRVGETTYTIINTRYDLNLPTIFTSNYNLDKLATTRYKGEDGLKIVDRIRGRSVDVKLSAPGYRSQELVNLMQEIENV